MTPEQFQEKIKEMDMIMLSSGKTESNQLICWAKVFYATTLFANARSDEAISMLQETIDQFVKTSLMDDPRHNQLESFYQ